MANTTQEAAKYDVCFVQSEDSSEKATETLKLAFETMDSNQLEPVWITVSDCLKISSSERKLFVVDPFEGVAFEHLKTVKCRIVGPLSILYCLQYGDVLPKRPYPIYSVSMRKITVSCSNIKVKMRDDISNKVQLMGGFFSKDLTKSVTHLVVGEVGSQKYKVAANFGLPIMTPEWITDVWENGQHRQLHATDSCYDKYKCPVFKGLIISVSQLSAEERLTLKKVIEENGGLYSGALKANETTHLVLSEPTGDKYRFAKSWKVICVNVKWIFDSVEAGYCRDETLYALDESAQTQPKRSTPKKDHTACDLPLVDCSVISVHPTVSHLDETMRTNVSIAPPNKRNSFELLEEFNLSTLPKFGQFLDGCKIFLTGFSATHMEKLRKIINSGGAMRFNKYSDTISHVVCGELTDDFLQSLRSSSVKPFVVNYKWLLECCKTEKLIDEKPFLCMNVTTLSPEKIDEKEVVKKEVSLHASQNSQIKKDDFATENMTDIFKQYLNNQQSEDDKENKGEKYENQITNHPQSKSKLSSSFAAKGQLNSSEAKYDDLPLPVIPVVDLEAEPEPVPPNPKLEDIENNLEAIENECISSSENLLAGMKFIIVGFGEKDSEILQNFIESHAGVISSQKNNSCDIAIVPLIWHDFDIPVSNIVTNCWLQKCVEESRIFDFDENELFRPFPIEPEKKPFESLVISFSQYVGTERDCLIYLAESLGATCQEYFVRKANPVKGVLSNTHLVVSLPNGSKYEASKKWKIPAVTKKWVIDAAKLGIVPPVDDYLVDRFPELPSPDENSKSVQNVSLKSESTKDDKKLDCSNEQNFVPQNKCVDKPSNKSLQQSHVRKSSDSFAKDSSITGATSKDFNIPEVKKVDTESSVLQHNRISELCNESRRESINKLSPLRPHADSSLDLSLSLNKSHNFKFHVSGVLKDLDTSKSRDSIGGNKRQSLPIEEMFTRNLASALHRLDDKTELEKEGDSKILEENNDPVEKPKILNGVVLYVSRKLSNIQIELNEIVVQLGGSYVWSYDDSCTHFVFVGKANDITREFREARNKGKKIVSPEWVYACKDKGSRVEEDLYPHTYKANMTLSQQISILKAPAPSSDLPKNEHDAITEECPPEKVNNILQPSETVPSKDVLVDFNKQLNELLVAAKSAKKRQSKIKTNSASSSPVTDISPIPKYPRHLSDVYVKPSSTKDNEEPPDTCSQHSQSYPIMWDDPTGRLEREKIAARAAKNAEELRKAQNQAENKKQKDSEKTRKFMFTNINDALKAEYIEIVKKLGGETSDEKAFDITATHLIIANPIKNEKFLSSVASGKWVLHPMYLSSSIEQDGFVNEEDFEWGGPSTEKFLKTVPSSNSDIAKCPHRWRTKLQKGIITTGAFDTWKVVIHAEDKTKLATYTKILEAGGAEIISPGDAAAALDKISHVFVDIKKKNPNRVNLSPYLSKNIKCIKPEYLAFYLIDEPPPDIETFLVPEAKENLTGVASTSKRRTLSTASRQSKKTRLK